MKKSPQKHSIEDERAGPLRARKRVFIQDFKPFLTLATETRLEWRDVERMLAASLEGLGFSVELAPPSKDGGRDIILRCRVFGTTKTFLIEVKHWSTPVGRGVVRDFIRVVLAEADRGLLLATTGYCSTAFEQLTEIVRRRVRGADGAKAVAICQMYVASKSRAAHPGMGLTADSPQILFEGNF